MIRILIIDDEELARERIRSFLNEHNDVKIIGECSDGKDAEKIILSEKPDLIFLDIQMPEVNGFDLLENIKSIYLPLVIFVTAFDEYAVKAFEFHAIDYLLKPFDRKRFNSALKHAVTMLNTSNYTSSKEHILSLLENLNIKSHSKDLFPQRFIIRESGKISFVETDEIEYLEAAGNYVKIKTTSAVYLMRETMNSMENKLNPKIFIRIHRSHIVRINQIKEFKTFFDGDYIVVLKNNTELKTGKAYRSKIRELFSSF